MAQLGKKIRQFSQLASYREIRNALLGAAVVLGGLGLAGLTLIAHLQGNMRLAGIAASASLVFVFLIVVFVVPPLARNANAEASQLNLPFEVTTGGAILIVLITVVAFAAWNTGNNLLFLVLAFIVSALVVGFIIGHVTLKRLDVKMRFPETVYSDEPTPIVVSLHSRKRLLPTISVTAEVRGKWQQPPDLKLRLSEFLPEKWAARIAGPPVVSHTLDYFFNVGRKDEVESRQEHVFKRRGRFEIKDFELSTRFPFALFRHRRRLPAQRAEIVVFQKPAEVSTDSLSSAFDAGTAVSRKKGLGRDLLTMREYQPQDDLRHIDWKATARTTRMIVRDFAAENELRVLLIIDPRIKKSESELAVSIRKQIDDSQRGIVSGESVERINQAAGNACFILTHFREHGAEIGVMTPDESFSPATGRRQFFECMRAASVTQPDFVDSFEPGEFDRAAAEFCDSMPGCQIYLIRARESGLVPETSAKLQIIEY